MLRNGIKTSFSESFHPFRAEPHSHMHSIYTVNAPILYLFWNNIYKQGLIKLYNKKDSGSPKDASCVAMNA